MFDFGFFPAVAGLLLTQRPQRSERMEKGGFLILDFSPRLRGTLTRKFWIGEEIAHAKVAKYAKENWLLVLGDWGG